MMGFAAFPAIKTLFTIKAHDALTKNYVGHDMGLEQDRLMMVRAELSEQLVMLRLTSFDANPVQFLMRLERIRKTAAEQRFAAVAEIAAVFEAAMQKVIERGGSAEVVGNFTSILEDAIGCREIKASAANAMLANVALRLHG
jgi:hypothetical protein